MQPVVHGLETTYGEEIEFVRLDIDNPDTKDAKEQYGFRYQPYFVLVNDKGEVVQTWNGRVEAKTFETAFATILNP